MSEKQLATSADASVRQIGVIRQIKENVREFENGGPDTEADDILLAISAGLTWDDLADALERSKLDVDRESIK